MLTANRSKELAPGPYWMLRSSRSPAGADVQVTVLSAVPNEPGVYNVRHHPSGAVIPCRGDLLHKF